MSQITSTPPSGTPPSGTPPSGTPPPGTPAPPRATQLVTEQGKTTIADVVVAKIAGIAAREVPGVHELLPQGAGGALAGFAQRVTGSDPRALGVNVEVGEREAAVDLRLVVDYGVSIHQVAEAVRQNVVARLQAMTGLVVREVNIAVDDLFFPEDAAPAPASARGAHPAAGPVGVGAPAAAGRAAAGGTLAVARAAAAAVRGVPGVAGLTPGRFAEAATYGPGEVVRGVAVRRRPGGYAVEVHVRAVYAPARPLPALAARVRRAVGAAVAALGGGPAGPIDVAVDDLDVGAAAAGAGRAALPGRAAPGPGGV